MLPIRVPMPTVTPEGIPCSTKKGDQKVTFTESLVTQDPKLKERYEKALQENTNSNNNRENIIAA